MSDELKFENLGGGVYKRADGKFFYADESDTFIGPFDSEESAREMLVQYEESLGVEEKEVLPNEECDEEEEEDWDDEDEWSEEDDSEDE
jgi:hypothetical protein